MMGRPHPSAQNRSRTPVAETDVPGHSQNDRDPCSKEGNDQRCSGCDAALTHRYDYRCLYTGNSGKRSVDDQFHQYGAAKVTDAKPEVFEKSRLQPGQSAPVGAGLPRA